MENDDKKEEQEYFGMKDLMNDKWIWDALNSKEPIC